MEHKFKTRFSNNILVTNSTTKEKMHKNKQQRDTNNILRIENDTIIVLFAHIMESERERRGQKFVKTIKSKYMYPFLLEF
jgi:hypothetical protein